MTKKQLNEIKLKAAKLPPIIFPSQIYSEAVKALKNEDIDHHGNGKGLDDLYLKVSPESTLLIERLPHTTLVTKFKDAHGEEWYDLPFCYPVPVPNLVPDENIMKKQSRFTSRDASGTAFTKYAYSTNGDIRGDAIELLAYYEDLIDKGLKPTLPCKPGDTAYITSPHGYGEFTVLKINITSEGAFLIFKENFEPVNINEEGKSLFFDLGDVKKILDVKEELSQTTQKDEPICYCSKCGEPVMHAGDWGFDDYEKVPFCLKCGNELNLPEGY